MISCCSTSATRPTGSVYTHLMSMLQVSAASSLGLKSASPLQPQTQRVPGTCRYLRLGFSRSQRSKWHSILASRAAEKLTVRQACVHCLLSEVRLQPEWETTLTGAAAERSSTGSVVHHILVFQAKTLETFLEQVM